MKELKNLKAISTRGLSAPQKVAESREDTREVRKILEPIDDEFEICLNKINRIKRVLRSPELAAYLKKNNYPSTESKAAILKMDEAASAIEDAYSEFEDLMRGLLS